MKKGHKQMKNQKKNYYDLIKVYSGIMKEWSEIIEKRDLTADEIAQVIDDSNQLDKFIELWRAL